MASVLSLRWGTDPVVSIRLHDCVEQIWRRALALLDCPENMSVIGRSLMVTRAYRIEAVRLYDRKFRHVLMLRLYTVIEASSCC